MSNAGKSGAAVLALGLSALVFTVIAYAAPREAATGKGTRTESSRLLSGADAQLRDDATGGVADGANMLYYRMAPTICQGGSAAGSPCAISGAACAGGGTCVAASDETVTILTPNNNKEIGRAHV